MATIKGGNKLEAALKEISRNASKAGVVRVGFLSNATYPDGTSIPMVAAVQEYGAPRAGIPPRPYFRTMVAAKAPEWPRAVGALLKSSNYDSEKTLTLMGEGIKGQLQQSIVDLTAPPLSQVTLMLRKMRSQDPDLKVTGKTVGEAARRVAAGESTSGVSTKPLVYSGDLLHAVDYEVKA